jgi:hypothetical protein
MASDSRSSSSDSNSSSKSNADKSAAPIADDVLSRIVSQIANTVNMRPEDLRRVASRVGLFVASQGVGPLIEYALQARGDARCRRSAMMPSWLFSYGVPFAANAAAAYLYNHIGTDAAAAGAAAAGAAAAAQPKK